MDSNKGNGDNVDNSSSRRLSLTNPSQTRLFSFGTGGVWWGHIGCYEGHCKYGSCCCVLVLLVRNTMNVQGKGCN